MYKGIYDFIMLLGFGGTTMVIGGLIGAFIGFQATEGCFLNCPDPMQFAVYGTFPGILLASIQWIVKQSSKRNQ
jgi:hypothetical protein